MTVKQTFDASNRHLAILGKFSVLPPASDGKPAALHRTLRSDQLDGEPLVDFSLRYISAPLELDGNRRFESYVILPPADPAASGEDARTIPVSSTPLAEVLGGAASTKEEVGGRLFVELANALDALAPFWHPNFDRLLAEGVFYYLRDQVRDNKGFTNTELRHLLYDTVTNRTLLAYLRAGPADAAHGLAALRKRVEDRLSEPSLIELFLDQVAAYRMALANEMSGAGTIETRVYGDRDGRRFVADHGVPGLGTDIRALHARYRKAAEVVENISRCEPLVALIISWFFRKVSDNNGAANIAKALYSELYETSKMWKPRMSSDKLDADQKGFESAFSARYAQIVQEEAERGGDRSARAIVYKLFMTSMVAHRGETWRPSRVYDKTALILDTVLRFLSLAALKVEGVEQLLNQGRDLLDQLQLTYLDFEGLYGAGLRVEALAPLLERLPGSFGGWGAAFLAEAVGKSGTELGDAFRESFNAKVAEVEHGVVQQFLDQNHDHLDKDLGMIERIYRAQLVAATVEGAFANPGGSQGVRDPSKASGREGAGDAEAEGDEQESTGAARPEARATEIYEKAVLSPGGTVSLPKPLRPPQEEVSKGGLARSLELPKGMHVDEAGTSLVFEVPFSRDELESASASVRGLDLPGLVDEAVLEMDRKGHLIEDLRMALLEGDGNLRESPERAPQRGTLRSLILGEHELSARAELSPLGAKDTSLGVQILNSIVEHVGSSLRYEGKTNREALGRDVTDTECGVRQVALPQIWQVSQGKPGVADLEALVQYWQLQANRVFAVREYVEDMREVTAILKAVGTVPGALVTHVNQTLAEHAGGDVYDLVNVADPNAGVVPPGVVFVSRQAGADLPALEAKILGDRGVFALAKGTGSGMGRTVTLPLFVGRQLRAQSLPVLETSMPEVDKLIALLLHPPGKNLSLSDKLGVRAKQLMNETGIMVGLADDWRRFWALWLREKAVEPLLVSKIISHVILTRVIDDKGPQARDAVYAGVTEVDAIVSPPAESIRPLLQTKKPDDTWQPIPATVNAYNDTMSLQLNGREIALLKTLSDRI